MSATRSQNALACKSQNLLCTGSEPRAFFSFLVVHTNNKREPHFLNRCATPGSPLGVPAPVPRASCVLGEPKSYSIRKHYTHHDKHSITYNFTSNHKTRQDRGARQATIFFPLPKRNG
ncbi:unnamed protein product [Ectocarpus sp. 8 AP-2014]